MIDRELDGLRALVTGASKGIGLAVAARLREAGAAVLATARTPPANVPDGGQFIAADVTTVQGCGTVAAAVRDRFGGIDLIVHVVGGSSAPAGGLARDDKTVDKLAGLNEDLMVKHEVPERDHRRRRRLVEHLDDDDAIVKANGSNAHPTWGAASPAPPGSVKGSTLPRKVSGTEQSQATEVKISKYLEPGRL